MTKEQSKLVLELKKAGYTAKEVERILQWLNDIDKKKFFTPEEVYKQLLAKQKVYV